MIWKRLLSSPPPATGWFLDGSAAVLARRDGKGELHCAFGELPGGVFDVGPVGIQSVHRTRLKEVLEPVQESARGARRAVVVIPTGWVRSHLLDFDELPRRQAELHEVVRWRLKKLLPVAPAELRLALVVMPTLEGRRQVLCTASLERALAELEEAFTDLGIEPGLVTPCLFALACRRHENGSRYRLVVQHEEGFLSLLLLADATPRLLRTKILPASDAPWPVVHRELHLALAYIRHSMALAEPLAVTVSAASAELDENLRTWWSSQTEVTVEAPFAELACAEPTLAERVGMARLGPVTAILGGGHG